MTQHFLPSISFGAQPNLGLLFRTLTDPSDTLPITIVCGAGLSRSAELPDWRQLIDRMCEAIEPPELCSILRNDPIDLMRKADYILRLSTRKRSAHEVIRDSLYRDTDGGTSPPGLLADAVARLAKTFPGRVRLLTTNFDNQLELALSRYYKPSTAPRSFALDQVAEWQASTSRKRAPGVLHVHGLVLPGQSPVGTLILSESYYLKFGPQVRAVITDALQTSHVIFVGVSMADPNLIGPLSDIRDTRDDLGTRAFLLVVPDNIEGADDRLIHLYAHRRAEYLEEALGLHAIVLKAFAEVPQVLYDVGLANREPEKYFSNNPRQSLRYGYRLTRALDEAYSYIGAKKGETFVSGDRQLRLSDALHAALYKRSGPGTFLRTIGRKLHSDWLDEHGLNHEFLASEQFGLFLWLRARSKRPMLGEAPPFSVCLVGTSAYAHREEWSLQREIPIHPGLSFVSDAVYFGSSQFRNLDDPREFPLWRSVVTCPIRWEDKDLGGAGEILCVGVITLNSTRSIVDANELRARASDGGDVRRGLKPSVISFLDSRDRDRLVASLQSSVMACLRPE